MQMDGNSDTSYQLVQDFDAKAQEELGKSNVAVQRVLAEPAVKQILPSSPAPIIIQQPVQVVMQPAGTGESIWTKRSEEHTSELQSLMRISYAVFCLKKKNKKHHTTQHILLHQR